MKHFKTTLLAIVLLFSVNTLMAQEKYQYAAIIYHTNTKKIYTSIGGTEYQEQKVNNDDQKNNWYDLSPVIKEVNKMSNDGWEVYDNEVQSDTWVYSYFLRRKEQ